MQIRQTTAQTVANSAFVPSVYNVTDADPLGAVYSTSTFAAPAAGWYSFHPKISWNINATGLRAIRLVDTVGNVIPGTATYTPAFYTSGHVLSHTTTADIYLNPLDRITEPFPSS